MPSKSIPLLAIIAALPVHAQQASTPPIGRIEIKADANTLRRNDTAARITIGRADIVRYGDVSVLDVVRRLPGVTVEGGAIRMRGLGAGYTQILINGERAPAGFALDSLAPEMIERIDVARTATADVSTQAIAGTINIILRKTVDRLTREVKVSYGAGDGQMAPGASVTLAGKTDTLSYTGGATLALNHRHSSDTSGQDMRDSAGALTRRYGTRSRYHNDYAALNLNARTTWVLAGGDSVGWQAFANVARTYGVNNGSTTSVFGTPYLIPSLDGKFRILNASGRTDVTWTRKLAAGAKFDTKAGLNLSTAERTLERVATGYARELLLERTYTTDAGDKSVSWSGKYDAPLGNAHNFAAGWDAGRSHYSQRELQQDTPIPPEDAFEFDNRATAIISRLAVYAQDEWEVSPAWSVYLGARWEQIDLRTTGPALTPSGTHAGVLSPILQSLWKIPGAKGSQVRLGLSRTYKAPEVRRLVPNHFYTSVNTELTPDSVGNPFLKPELALGVDAAYEYYWDKGALFSVSATTRSIDDLIQNTITLEDGRHVSRATNSGKAQMRALELELKFPIKAFSVRASASRNWSKVSSIPGPDNRLDRQPRWSTNLGADYQHGAFSGGASVALVGAGSTRISLFETRYVSPRRDVEAYGLYRINPREQVRLTARNLLTTDSASSAHYADANGSKHLFDQSPGRVSWRVQYEIKL